LRNFIIGVERIWERGGGRELGRNKPLKGFIREHEEKIPLVDLGIDGKSILFRSVPPCYVPLIPSVFL
jgi:hypothetical protein